nr:tetratricopeptide repeat protein [uncultured Pseudomonas sp.]
MPEEKNKTLSLEGSFEDCEVVSYSDYCMAIIRDRSLPTLIAFSSVNTPRGKFKPFKVISECSCNIIFINDSANNWYLKGVEGIAEGYKSSALKIVEIARSIGNGKAITFGTSMGAYGALLYAAAGNADCCLSFGPEVLLDLPGSRSEQHKTKEAQLPYGELVKLIEESSTPFYVFTSECDEIDLINALSLNKLKNVQTASVRGVEHPGIQVFSEKAGVAEFVDRAIKSPESIFQFEQRGALLESEELIKDLWIAYSLRKEKKVSGCLAYLESQKWKSSSSSAFMHRLGEAYYRNGNQALAAEYLGHAIRLDELQFESYNLLGVIQRRKKLYASAEENLKKSLAISPRNAFAHHNLGLLLLDVQRVDEAISCFEKAVKINKGNSTFAKSLIEAKEMLATAN